MTEAPKRTAATAATSQAKVPLGETNEARATSLHLQTGQPLQWVIVALVLLAFPISIAWRGIVGRKSGPPPIVDLPAWQLTSDAGKPFGSIDLAGRAYVVNFFFTSCPSICPKLMKRMAEVEQRTAELGSRLQIVSISVDPENDTPAAMLAYAPKYRTDPKRWALLTGDHERLQRVVVQGFKVAMGSGQDAGAASDASIFHSEKFLLVDKRGRVRRYYDADDAGIAQLESDAALVVAE